jgi:agmatinase
MNVRDNEGMFGLPNTPLEKAKIVFIPVPWEGTVSYGKGTAEAPRALLEASEQLDWYDLDVANVNKLGFHFLNGEKEDQLSKFLWETFGATSPADADKLDATNKAGLKVNEYTYNQTMRCYRHGQIPAVVGGEHSVSFGAIEAAGRKYPTFDILHIDAHMDMRNAYEGYTWSHASVMFNVAARIPGIQNIVQVGIRDFCTEELEYVDTLNSGVEKPRIKHIIESENMFGGLGQINTKVWTHFDQELAREKFQGKTWLRLCDRILAPLHEYVWVTIDIDGLNPSWCPRTGTPVPGGLEYNELVFLLKRLALSGRKIIGFDLVEVGNSEWDANVGMRLLYKMSGFAAASQKILEWRSSPKII